MRVVVAALAKLAQETFCYQLAVDGCAGANHLLLSVEPKVIEVLFQVKGNTIVYN